MNVVADYISFSSLLLRPNDGIFLSKFPAVLERLLSNGPLWCTIQQEIIDVSSGCGENYAVIIVSSAFEGKMTLARHRMSKWCFAVTDVFSVRSSPLTFLLLISVNELLKPQIAQMHAFSQVGISTRSTQLHSSRLPTLLSPPISYLYAPSLSPHGFIEQKSFTPKQWEAEKKAKEEAAAVKEELKETVAESDPPASTA